MISPWLTVLTTPARPEYLAVTLDSLGRASLFRGHRIVFVDGDPKRVTAPRGWTKIGISDGGASRGSRRAMWKILHLAAVAGVPEALYFEDDVRVCRHGVLAMSGIAVPAGVAFLAFCNQKAGLPSAPPAIHCRRADDPANAPGHWGSQALKLPARSLRMFTRAETEPPRDGYAYAADVWLGQQLATQRTSDHFYGIVVPALVRHVGERTTIPSQAGATLDDHRQGLNYAGDDFDARALLASNLPVIGM